MQHFNSIRYVCKDELKNYFPLNMPENMFMQAKALVTLSNQH